MKPVFVDLHIHTSENPEDLNKSYNLKLLKSKIEEIADGSDYLISLTDHNTINEDIYLKAVKMFDNILLGVELHVNNHSSKKPYHCHIYFNLKKIDSLTIKDLNEKLNILYPKKVISPNSDVPTLENIMQDFDAYEFVLLPHGGQSHSTFHKSIPKNSQIDNALERSIYYNLFDGFTARSNNSLEKTLEYFDRLGIKEFINLVTSSDNYSPEIYPNVKSSKAAPFVCTWMMAIPTFNGLRLSLSESSRFEYGDKPDSWAEYIRSASLKNDMIDIDVDLTPGLNVVIGGSSSGKTLFVDSLVNNIKGDFELSDYLNIGYEIQDINVVHPAGQIPHYFEQNYIMKICDNKNKESTINNIPILSNIFPEDAEERRKIQGGLKEINSQVASLVQSVEKIESLHDKLSRLPSLSHLIVTSLIQDNPLKYVLPSEEIVELFEYGDVEYGENLDELNRVDEFLLNNPFIKHDNSLIEKLKEELLEANEISNLELKIRDIINIFKDEIDDAQQTENKEATTKRKNFDELIRCIKQYFKAHKKFYYSLKIISRYSIESSTKEVKLMGHKMFIHSEFELTKKKFLEVINSSLKTRCTIEKFEDIKPDCLFKKNFKGKAPKISNYEEFESYVKNTFQKMDTKKYKIITKGGKDFDKLSAGWKTSVILDLILGSENDTAPIIIDQPEDNLATGYINLGLLEAIKKCKKKKQIILVSHNATIPMLGDAQNVIMCRNSENVINIRSNPLEGTIDGRNVVDLVAEITDGGKISIKKRVKKYNLKNFRGSNEISIQED